MRGTVAKRIRKEARAISTPTQHKIAWYKILLNKFTEKGERVVDYRGTIICSGYRRIYQDIKKKRKENR